MSNDKIKLALDCWHKAIVEQLDNPVDTISYLDIARAHAFGILEEHELQQVGEWFDWRVIFQETKQ